MTEGRKTVRGWGSNLGTFEHLEASGKKVGRLKTGHFPDLVPVSRQGRVRVTLRILRPESSGFRRSSRILILRLLSGASVLAAVFAAVIRLRSVNLASVGVAVGERSIAIMRFVRLDVIKMVFLISWVVSEQPIGPLKEG